MKKSLALFALTLIMRLAHADEASPAQLLRKQFVNGCVGQAITRQEDAVSAAKFCTCAFEVLAKELTVAEYIEFDQASHDRRAPETLPGFARLKPKLAQCKN